MKNKTWKGIKKAVGETKCCPLYWRIYADYSNNTIWCMGYASENSWNAYHSKSIKNICSGHGYNSIFGQTKITMNELKEKLEDVDQYYAREEYYASKM